MNKNLPVYKISIDPEYAEGGENLGIEMIAFVKNPAVKVKGMAFHSQEPKKQFFTDNLKYRIVAPAMIPMEIYRRDESEYYVQFTAEEIERIHSKFMSTINQKDVFNLEHKPEDKVPAYVLEAWFVEDPETDKAKTIYGIDVPKGTLMMTSQVTDEEYYKKLVAEDQVGYSIEGFLGLALSEINEKSNEMSKQEFGMKLPEGEHLIGDKIYVIDADGNIVEIKEKEAMAEEVVEDEVKEEEKVEEVAMATEEEVIEDEVKEEELAEEVVEDAPAEEAKSYTKEELDAKFDELYQMIADLKTPEVKEEIKEMEYSNKLPIEARMSAVLDFLKKS